MLCGILRHSKEYQPDPSNFLDRKDSRFKKLYSTCDVVFRSLHETGIGTKKTSTPAITKEDENRLWETGVLNTKMPTGLQRAVFYYVGKVRCLRGGEEQRKLKPSQFTRLYNPERYEYIEHGSKNRNGGFYQLDVENKNVSIFKNDGAGKRCLVNLLDLYLKKLPQSAITQGVFYCRSLDKYKEDGPWCSKQARGQYYLNAMVKSMFEEAGAQAKYTNHSLQATGATELFQSYVPEKVTQNITGHRSLKALRQYEKVGDAQKQAASNILTGTSKTYAVETEKLIPCSSTSGNLPLPMPVFSPVLNCNSTGTVNFTVNMYPTGNIAIGNTANVEEDIDFHELFEGTDVTKDLI